MKVLIVGDAACSTGFARCTHAAADALFNAGDEVTVLGINYFGRPHNSPYDIWPSYDPTDGGFDGAAASHLPVLIDRVQPDVVVILNDPWNIDGYVSHARQAEHKPLLVGWIAVDGANQQAEALNQLDHVIVWTAFGMNQLRAGGYTGQLSVVPLGVDHSVYQPQDITEARRVALAPAVRDHIGENPFIIGVVGRNQLRKRLDLTLRYFNYFIRKYSADRAFLYLHVAPTGENGTDLASLCRFHELGGRVIMGNPHMGLGVEDDLLVSLYNSMDVYTTTSQGEGWGLPALEAMACGIPCVLPDYAAFGPQGWVQPKSAELVQCSTYALTAPLDGNMHTIGGIPDMEAWSWAMHNLYSDPGYRSELSELGIKVAAQFDWEHTGRGVMAVLESVTRRLQPMPKAGGYSPSPATGDYDPSLMVASMKELG